MKKFKLKTHKGTAKRVKKTGSGKMMRRQAMTSHFKGKENSKQSQRRRRGNDKQVPESNPRIDELIPYN